MKKKNILIFMPVLFWGGAETQFRLLISNLDITKYNINVLTLEPINNNKFIKTHEHINFYSLNFNFTKYESRKYKKIFHLKNYIFTFIKLITLLKRKNFHTIISYGMIIAPFIPLLKIFSEKVIYSERTATEILYKRKWLTWFYNFADIITCNTPYTKEILENIGVGKVKVIFNGVTINDCETNKPYTDKASKKIAIIARIHPVKNQLIALKALKKLKNKELLLIGKVADQNYYKELISYANENNLNNRVTFRQFTEDITSVYQQSDLILLPSIEEGLSNVILESFKNKRYCIASSIRQNKFLLNQGKGGLFDLDSVDNLIEEIKKFDELDTNSRNEKVKLNFEYLKENFSIEKMVQDYENLVDNKH